MRLQRKAIQLSYALPTYLRKQSRLLFLPVRLVYHSKIFWNALQSKNYITCSYAGLLSSDSTIQAIVKTMMVPADLIQHNLTHLRDRLDGSLDLMDRWDNKLLVRQSQHLILLR